MNDTKNIEPTIAILPFENLTENKKLQLLCDGFTYDIMMELSKFKQFQIISLDNYSVGNATEKDNVILSNTDYHIKGSFRNFNNRLRINAHLIETKSQRLVWADRMENDVEEIFTIQGELLQQIVAALQENLDVDLLTKIHRHSTKNLKAYEFWLYGFSELKKGTIEADLKARSYFEQAIDIDPSYSLAHSGMSLSYFNEWSCQIWPNWDVNQKGAKEWAKKAIELDEQNYIANLIAGKIHIFERDYALGEVLLKKAEQLNSNDPFNLIQIASSYIYLGLLNEAERLYLKALKLRPYRQQDYHAVGAYIYFEKGEFEKALEVGGQFINVPWVDYPAVIAAAHFYLGNYTMSNKYWQMYLDSYIEKIVKTPKISEADALQWMVDINPYKGETKLEAFWDYIRQEKHIETKVSDRVQIENKSNCFMKKEGIWFFSYENDTAQLPDSKGLHDIYQLLSQPYESIHCSQLMGSGIVEESEMFMDDRAKKEYKNKIVEIQRDIKEAEETNDLSRISILQEEYEYLIDHLSKSLDIKGKSRKFQRSDDKARSAVTQRIRSSINKLAQVHPRLSMHLKNSIQTGAHCSYVPSQPTIWEL